MPRGRVWTIIVGAIGVLGVIAATAQPSVASTPPGDPIELPDTLSGGLTALDLPEAYPDSIEADTVEEQVADRQAANEYAADGFSDALGGVPAAVRVYAPDDLALFYTVLAVRAELSPLIPFDYVDPEWLGLAKPPTELVRIDDVNCLVGWSPVPAGQQPTDDDRQNVICQVTAEGVTVRISANTGETPEHVAALAVELVAQVAAR